MAWENVCTSKVAGGLGLKDLELQNRCLLLKFVDNFFLVNLPLGSTGYFHKDSIFSESLPPHLLPTFGRLLAMSLIPTIVSLTLRYVMVPLLFGMTSGFIINPTLSSIIYQEDGIYRSRMASKFRVTIGFWRMGFVYVKRGDFW